jgi:hypothetical protein
MIDKNDIKDEHIEEAYRLLKEYCKEHNEDIVTFVNNKDNVKKASEHIHKKLNFALRLIFKPAKIEKLILDNHDFIVEKAQHYAKLDNQNKKA